MGRKRRQKIVRRPQKKIPDIYPCPDCGNTSIKIEIKREENRATVRCGVCGIEMEITPINSLTEPVDVYGTFVDKFYEERKIEA